MKYSMSFSLRDVAKPILRLLTVGIAGLISFSASAQSAQDENFGFDENAPLFSAPQSSANSSLLRESNSSGAVSAARDSHARAAWGINLEAFEAEALKKMAPYYRGTFLNSGDKLQENQWLNSANGNFYALFYKGSLCVYSGKVPWMGNPLVYCGLPQRPSVGEQHLAIQSDGNLCAYSGQSGTANGYCTNKYDKQGQYHLIMQDDGNLVVYKGPYDVDASRTPGAFHWGIKQTHEQQVAAARPKLTFWQKVKKVAVSIPGAVVKGATELANAQAQATSFVAQTAKDAWKLLEGQCKVMEPVARVYYPPSNAMPESCGKPFREGMSCQAFSEIGHIAKTVASVPKAFNAAMNESRKDYCLPTLALSVAAPGLPLACGGTSLMIKESVKVGQCIRKLIDSGDILELIPKGNDGRPVETQICELGGRLSMKAAVFLGSTPVTKATFVGMGASSAGAKTMEMLISRYGKAFTANQIAADRIMKHKECS